MYSIYIKFAHFITKNHEIVNRSWKKYVAVNYSQIGEEKNCYSKVRLLMSFSTRRENKKIANHGDEKKNCRIVIK